MCTILIRRASDCLFSGTEIIVPRRLSSTDTFGGKIGLSLLQFPGDSCYSAALGSPNAAGFEQSVVVKFADSKPVNFSFLLSTKNRSLTWIDELLDGAAEDLIESQQIVNESVVEKMRILIKKTFELVHWEADKGILQTLPKHDRYVELCKEGAVTNSILFEQQSLPASFDHLSLSASVVSTYEELEMHCGGVRAA